MPKFTQGFIVRTAQVTMLQRSIKRHKMKTAQSMHPEINCTIEFSTLIGTPKGSDQLSGINVDTKKIFLISCIKCLSSIELSNNGVS